MKRLLLLLGLLFSILLSAQTRVNSSIDTNMALIGDVIKLSISVESSTPVVWPDVDKELAPLEIQEKSQFDTVQNSLQTRYKQELFLQYFDTGIVNIPSLAFLTQEDTFYSDSIAVAFLGFELDSANTYFDIKSPKKVPFNFEEAKPYIYLIIFLILLIFLFIKLISRFKKKSTIDVDEIPETPCDEEAIKRLELLELKKLYENNQTKKHYIELTRILRHYFDRRFNIDTLESTTDEIIEILNKHIHNKSLVTEINTLLCDADLVKFAKIELDSPLNEDYMKKAFKIVTICQEIKEEVNDV